jgi:glucose/arabinose dehydrogenase
MSNAKNIKKTTLIMCFLGCILNHNVNAQHVAGDFGQYSTAMIASGLNQPWAHEFLPNGDILVTERVGSIKVVRDGALLAANVSNVPDVYFAGQGGLLDIMLDADFKSNRTVYLSYAYGSFKGNATRLISAKLIAKKDSYQLDDIQTVFTASPLKQAPQHYSGRIAQMADGTLLLTVGEGFDYREQAQKLDNHLGKIIRVNRDGSVPVDNPFVKKEGAKPEIWSYGHRNHQALLVANGVVYQNEHGPKGGDEVNIIKPGLNYGWPIITRGRDYNGAQVTPYNEYPGMEQPLVDWTPSIAPSSMVFHNNSLYVTALAEQSIRKLSINGNQITDQGKVFTEIKGRIRDISTSPDGKLYVLTDGEEAQLVKITQTNSD